MGGNLIEALRMAFAKRALVLLYAATVLSLLSMMTSSTLVPLLFNSLACQERGHNSSMCEARAFDHPELARISGDAASYLKFYETGGYFAQLIALCVIGPAADTIGRRAVLMLSITGLAVDAAATAVFAWPLTIVVVHCLCSTFSGSYLIFTALHAIAADISTEVRQFSIACAADRVCVLTIMARRRPSVRSASS
jgi:MFS family permease